MVSRALATILPGALVGESTTIFPGFNVCSAGAGALEGLEGLSGDLTAVDLAFESFTKTARPKSPATASKITAIVTITQMPALKAGLSVASLGAVGRLTLDGRTTGVAGTVGFPGAAAALGAGAEGAATTAGDGEAEV